MSTPTSTSYVYTLYLRAQKWPFGQQLFSWFFARKAPYFRTIKPRIRVLKPDRCELTFKKRRAVTNHIGTVHAIALCNGLEMAMGALAEASIPAHLRWIPKGMNVQYTARANSDIRVIATINPAAWQLGDVSIAVEGLRADGTVVIQGEVILYVSEKPPKSV